MDDMKVEKRVLSPEDVAELLNVSRNLVYRQARMGLMPGWIRVGDKWLISRVNIEKYINGEFHSERLAKS